MFSPEQRRLTIARRPPLASRALVSIANREPGTETGQDDHGKNKPLSAVQCGLNPGTVAVALAPCAWQLPPAPADRPQCSAPSKPATSPTNHHAKVLDSVPALFGYRSGSMPPGSTGIRFLITGDAQGGQPGDHHRMTTGPQTVSATGPDAALSGKHAERFRRRSCSRWIRHQRRTSAAARSPSPAAAPTPAIR